MQHWVRTGLFGQVGRYSSAAGEVVARGRRVICRTTRGLEIGTVLGPAELPASTAVATDVNSTDAAWYRDGELLRRMTPEDELLWARLESNRSEAFQACVELLEQRGLAATLVDVEPLFDGSSLIFYFLGEVTAEIDQLTRELADAYDSRVQFRQFADVLERGCGPDCGTEKATGCGTDGGCASCSIAAACRKD